MKSAHTAASSWKHNEANINVFIYPKHTNATDTECEGHRQWPRLNLLSDENVFFFLLHLDPVSAQWALTVASGFFIRRAFVRVAGQEKPSQNTTTQIIVTLTCLWRFIRMAESTIVTQFFHTPVLFVDRLFQRGAGRSGERRLPVDHDPALCLSGW